MAEDDSYELHSYRQGRWRLESEYDDRELAIISAGLLLDGGDAEAARVVREVVGPKGKPSYRVVFRQTAAERSAEGGTPKPRRKAAPRGAPVPSSHAPAGARNSPAKGAARPTGQARQAAAGKGTGNGKRKKKRGYGMLAVYVLLLGGLALGAMAAMVFLRQLIRVL